MLCNFATSVILSSFVTVKREREREREREEYEDRILVSFFLFRAQIVWKEIWLRRGHVIPEEREKRAKERREREKKSEKHDF